jgi:hypothetical protein
VSAIDNAIARLQNIAAACTGVTFKSAQDYPTDNVEPFPASIAYISGGTFHLTNATIHHNFPVIALELHFSRVNVKRAYQDIDAIAIELPKRLAADPTLDGTIDTIVASRDEPITYEVRPFQWTPAGVTPIITSQMLKFLIPIKTLQAPQVTST